MWMIVRSIARSGIGIITFPVSLTIDRYILRKNGPNIGTIILLFIFVNCSWLIPILGGALEGIIQMTNPSWKGLGKETAAVLLIFTGTYFYWLPIGCLFCLSYFMVMKRNHPNFIYILYKMLEYLLVITPVSSAIYTLFSFHILYAFQYIPHGNGISFFQPDNFFHYASLNFPFVGISWNFKNPAIYFSLYGVLAGIVSSTGLWLSEINSGRRLYKSSVKEALSGKSQRQGFAALGILYALVIFWLVVLPVFSLPVRDPGEIIIRIACSLFLALPLLFHSVLTVCRSGHEFPPSKGG